MYLIMFIGLFRESCMALKEFICSGIVSIFIQSSQSHTNIFSIPNDKETRGTNQKQTVRAFLQIVAYSMNIVLLQFYKQMYNKYIINRLLLWDSEEPASEVFFSLSLSAIS